MFKEQCLWQIYSGVWTNHVNYGSSIQRRVKTLWKLWKQFNINKDLFYDSMNKGKICSTVLRELHHQIIEAWGNLCMYVLVILTHILRKENRVNPKLI